MELEMENLNRIIQIQANIINDLHLLLSQQENRFKYQTTPILQSNDNGPQIQPVHHVHRSTTLPMNTSFISQSTNPHVKEIVNDMETEKVYISLIAVEKICEFVATKDVYRLAAEIQIQLPEFRNCHFLAATIIQNINDTNIIYRLDKKRALVCAQNVYNIIQNYNGMNFYGLNPAWLCQCIVWDYYTRFLPYRTLLC